MTVSLVDARWDWRRSLKALHVVYNKFNLLHSNPTSASSSSLFILLITVLTLNFDTFFIGYPLMKMHAEFLLIIIV